MFDLQAGGDSNPANHGQVEGTNRFLLPRFLSVSNSQEGSLNPANHEEVNAMNRRLSMLDVAFADIEEALPRLAVSPESPVVPLPDPVSPELPPAASIDEANLTEYERMLAQARRIVDAAYNGLGDA